MLITVKKDNKEEQYTNKLILLKDGIKNIVEYNLLRKKQGLLKTDEEVLKEILKRLEWYIDEYEITVGE